KLETDLSGQPERQAILRQTLGGTYRALGLPDQAIPLQEKVRDYFLNSRGREDPKTLQAMLYLGACYHEAGRLEEAFRLHEEALALCRQVLGSEHPVTLHAMSDLAVTSSTFDPGRLEKTIQLMEEVL